MASGEFAAEKHFRIYAPYRSPILVVGIVFSFDFIFHPPSKCQTVLSIGICRIT
jgi:hypothetical protein